jgi:hypothetical protein
MEASQMEEQDKTLKELATVLSFASLILTLIALFMIRFGYTRPENEIWNCVIFLLKGCVCGWFYSCGRYSVKELSSTRTANYMLILRHTEERLNDQKIRLEEQLSKTESILENLKRELESSKLREEALSQKVKAFTRTPADANNTALKSFL